MLVIFSHSYLVCTGSEAGDPFNILTRPPGHRRPHGSRSLLHHQRLPHHCQLRALDLYPRLPQAKRVRRIYPGFIVVTMLSALFCRSARRRPCRGHHAFRAGGKSVLTHALRLRDFDADQGFAGNPYPAFMNASLWSISYEFYCYLGVVAAGPLWPAALEAFADAQCWSSRSASAHCSASLAGIPAASMLGRALGLPALLGTAGADVCSRASVFLPSACASAAYQGLDGASLRCSCSWRPASAPVDRAVSRWSADISSWRWPFIPLPATAPLGPLRRFLLWHLSVCVSHPATDPAMASATPFLRSNCSFWLYRQPWYAQP